MVYGKYTTSDLSDINISFVYQLVVIHILYNLLFPSAARQVKN